MGLLILGYLDISTIDYDWIQRVRKASDNRYFTVVEPHFTIVFAVPNLSKDKLLGHVVSKMRNFGKINFVLDHAQLVQDDSQKFWHTFLVPSAGYEEITRLHDELYTGILESELRKDIPFIPHVGIGTNENQEIMHTLASEINDKRVSIRGKISTLTIATFENGKVDNLDKLSLVTPSRTAGA